MHTHTPTPAELDTIAATRPNLIHLARALALRHPQLDAQIWKAIKIIIDGKVKPPRGDFELAQVIGSYQQNYSIQLTDERKTICDCKDHPTAPQTKTNGIRFCKHVLAHHLDREEESLNKIFAALASAETMNALFIRTRTPEGVTANV